MNLGNILCRLINKFSLEFWKFQLQVINVVKGCMEVNLNPNPGILKCNLTQIIIGTMPILVFVIPTVCTGAFAAKTAAIWATLTTLMFTVSCIICATLGVSSGYAVQEVQIVFWCTSSSALSALEINR